MESRRILLVEDNADDEELTIRSLNRVGLKNRIDVVRDGAEALDYLFSVGEYSALKEQPLPLAVLLDLGLPKVGGLEVLRKVRENERTRGIPVVVLTSSDEEADKITSTELGASCYVQKPVAFEEFGRAITKLGLYLLIMGDPTPTEK